MVSHLFYYQLALLALVWLFVMLPVAASRRGTPIPPTATLIKPKRTRSHEPQPFAGLTHKPLCALCEHEAAHPQAPPPVPPEPMPPPPPPPPHGGHLQALLSPCRLSLSRLAGMGQSAGQWSSQWRPLAAVPLYGVRRLLFRNPGHALPR